MDTLQEEIKQLKNKLEKSMKEAEQSKKEAEESRKELELSKQNPVCSCNYVNKNMLRGVYACRFLLVCLPHHLIAVMKSMVPYQNIKHSS